MGIIEDVKREDVMYGMILGAMLLLLLMGSHGFACHMGHLAEQRAQAAAVNAVDEY